MQGTLKTILLSILSSSLVATGISTYFAKSSELETRTYELKYEIYSEIDQVLAELTDALHFGPQERVAELARDLAKKVPHLLLVTRNHGLVRQLVELRDKILEPKVSTQQETEKTLDQIVRITVQLSDDFSSFVTTDQEIESMLGRKLKAKLLQNTRE